LCWNWRWRRRSSSTESDSVTISTSRFCISISWSSSDWRESIVSSGSRSRDSGDANTSPCRRVDNSDDSTSLIVDVGGGEKSIGSCSTSVDGVLEERRRSSIRIGVEDGVVCSDLSLINPESVLVSNIEDSNSVSSSEETDGTSNTTSERKVSILSNSSVSRSISERTNLDGRLITDAIMERRSEETLRIEKRRIEGDGCRGCRSEGDSENSS